MKDPRTASVALFAVLLAALSLFLARPTTAQELSEEYGFDHPGGDYNSFQSPTLGGCKSACRKDRRCQAYTYLSRKQECYLKDRVGPAGRSGDSVTGVKEGREDDDDRGGRGSGGRLTEEWGYDRSGSDYRSFDVRTMGECKRACGEDRRCQAFTFLTRTTTCYLKDRAGYPQRQNGAVTGAKGGGGGFNRFISGLTEEAGYDRKGDDYSRTRARDLSACKVACRRDSRCRAYTFITTSGDCYLKNRINSQEYNPEAVTGYKE
jgi:hypothetical protein